ncbi:ABC transporter ATP-binding protein [Xylocopilactobacillus apicola]|uniref:Dipeptide/oligopeptide/nickel ABC transporter ATP-binding protein n=1 Tax=Xylocopilactobacillus apicola TaxID=2932184 RepID=A0AAU9D3Y2_9LACO|nr:ABC transporter ATP-binding protein [Xylocopilactobacillus apicola]BDR58168.1 dipeptide/oligopeptide/nickel ABC transporter ATP-binding protein [Xylocopilactobacillus apicola]
METEKDNTLLEIDHLHTSFKIGGKYYDAVDDCSMKLHKNEIYALVGESGCGKSTLATSIIGLLDPKNSRIEGSIKYRGRELVGLTPDEYDNIRGEDIGMIFQDPLSALNPLMRVGDQITEALLYHTKLSENERQAKALELLKRVGIPDPEGTFRRYPHELSGGMRQRIIISIAVACSPEIIIADEPTTALDVTIQAQIIDLLKDIQKEKESGILLITHDLGVVAETADRVGVMYAGQIVETGSVYDIFEDPKHPYTRSLLNSIPQSDSLGDRLHVIQGSVPPLPEMNEHGCRFSPRIPWIPEDAHEEKPTYHEVGEGHQVLCTCYETFHFQDEK